VPGVVADPRQPSDHLGDPRQGRQVGVEPCARTPASRARSTRRQSASESREGCPSGPDRLAPPGSTLAPAGMPAAGGLAGT
jgi:hypothetical protein